ncbi:MAG: hypothetical protein ACJ768_08150 [Gaiellaceae bacterium]
MYTIPKHQAAEQDSARIVRRRTMPVLLDRAQHGVLTPQEAELLRQHIDAEMRDADMAHSANVTITRLTAWCDELDAGARDICRDNSVEHPVAANIRARIAGPLEG